MIRLKMLSFAPTMGALNKIEKRAAFSIALLVALRMYGLFLIMPIFAVYAENILDATPLLVGIAIGVYGLTQAVLQIPMGLLSDFIGRKRVITLGLLLFCLGSVIAASSENIWLIIIGRAIQGMGAIASTGMALIADVSREEQRGKMMGIVGGSIGLAFILAFITGPILAANFGLDGVFWITALLAVLALFQLHIFVEEPKTHVKKSFSFNEMMYAIKQKDLLMLDISIFLLHATMTAVFVVLPVIWVNQLGFALEDHWKLYLPVLLLSLLIMVPLIILQEKKKKHQYFITAALFVLGLTQYVLGLSFQSFSFMVFLMVLYFGLFNYLEAAMPAYLSRVASKKYRGAAMGMFSSSEFLGAFFGGAVAGWLSAYQPEYVFYLMSGLIVLASGFNFLLLRASIQKA